MVKNAFFDLALKRAAKLLGKKGRLVVLVTKLGVKLKDVKWSEIKTADVREKFMVVGRLVKAYATGQYRNIPWKPMLLLTATILYFISPLDAIPDLIPGLGLMDDIGILLTVYNSIHTEFDKFLVWEKSKLSTPTDNL